MAFTGLKKEGDKETRYDKSNIFTPLKEIEVVPGLKIGIWGPPETGKTYFIGTCPEPVYVIDTEFGTAQVYKYHFPDKEIYVKNVRIAQKDPTKVDYEATFKQIEDAVYSLQDLERGTIAIDSMSDVYTWMNAWVEDTAPRQKSKSGNTYMMQTEWGKRNTRYRNLVYSMISLPINIVFTAQPKKEYGGASSSEGTSGTGYIARWLDAHDHWVDVVLKMVKYEPKSKPPEYWAYVDKCRMQRASNLKIRDVTYPKLLKTLDEKFKLRIKGVDYDAF